MTEQDNILNRETNLWEHASILVVDDDPEIREIISILLDREGFTVREAADANTAFTSLQQLPVNLIILDIMMPGDSGFEFCAELRKTSTVPILFLSAKTADIDKAEGFDCGGDDYLIKPFSSIELISRVKALLRRHLVYQQRAKTEQNSIIVGDLHINQDMGSVTLAGQEIQLTSIEYHVLRFLMQNRKKILSAREIYEHVWQEPFLPLSNNTVMVHIKNLRKKLEKDVGHPQYIHTAWGKGYYIE